MDLERSPPASSAEAPGDGGGGGAAACSICLDAVLARSAGRSVAKLQCGHEFHLGRIPRAAAGLRFFDFIASSTWFRLNNGDALTHVRMVSLMMLMLMGVKTARIAELIKILLPDCIGSAFNAKGAMQCPNCRKIEKGRWLYASGHRASVDIDMGGWVTSDNYDITSELPFGFQWCPFSGFTRLASMFE
ncbi:RING/U-box superfamily protein [Zea mays]|uniref:RING/U-box superfamily protein n=1 Tax=Zea mays TaxID=4577 RepID=A0A1D6QIY2_MAIZE|nr:RING/U-box superfamily protein [Zea mays]